MFGVDADDPYDAFAMDQLALNADFFNRRANLHLVYLLHDPAPGQVAFGELDFHPVSRQKPDPVLLPGPGDVRQNPRFVTQFEPVQQAR